MFEGWRDQQLIPSPGERDAYEVAFAPDFASSNLIWAVVDNGSDRYLLTSTISPGQWGMTIVDILLRDQGGTTIRANEYVDIAFGDSYTSNAPVL